MTMSLRRSSQFLSLAVLCLLLSGVLNARSTFEDWSGTVAAVVQNNTLFSIERSGVLYSTNLATGRWTAIGKPEYRNTRLLFAGPQNLYTIEQDGSFYRVDPKDGSWVRVGQAGAWKGTLAGAFVAGRLFTVEADGRMYATSPVDGKWVQVGKAEFANTYRLFSTDDALFSIEKDGSLYRIDPSSGAWRRLGKAG